MYQLINMNPMRSRTERSASKLNVPIGLTIMLVPRIGILVHYHIGTLAN